MLNRITLLTVGALLGAVSLFGSVRQESQDAWRPGLGEIMTNIQRHHAALYFAGKGANWELAAYEVKELEEGFADAGTFHAVHEGVKVKELVDAIVPPALQRLHDAVEKSDKELFKSAHAALTGACNACHLSAQHAFIVIQEPTAPPASNQTYEKKR